MSTLVRFEAVAVLLAALAVPSRAEPLATRSSDLDRWRLSAAVDPLPFASGGYAASVQVKPSGARRWLFGAAVQAFNALPGNTPFRTYDLLGALQAGYFFGVDPLPAWSAADTEARGLFVSALLGVRLSTLTRADFPGPSSGLTQGLAAATVGYRWFPFGTLVYVAPQIGLAVTPLVAGDTTIGDRTFSEVPLLPLVLVPIGIQL